MLLPVFLPIPQYLLVFQYYFWSRQPSRPGGDNRNGEGTGGVNNGADGCRQDMLGQKYSLEDHGMGIFLEYVMVRWKTCDITETVPSGERF